MESGDEDEAFTMGERDWQKMHRDMTKHGYRDGRSEGREKGMQESFEKATPLALKYSLKLGQLEGLIEWQLSQIADGKKEKLTNFREKIISLQRNLSDGKSGSGCELGADDFDKDWKNVLDELTNELVKSCLDYPAIVNVIS